VAHSSCDHAKVKSTPRILLGWEFDKKSADDHEVIRFEEIMKFFSMGDLFR
jgi:hypothetical protein